MHHCQENLPITDVSSLIAMEMKSKSYGSEDAVLFV